MSQSTRARVTPPARARLQTQVTAPKRGHLSFRIYRGLAYQPPPPPLSLRGFIGLASFTVTGRPS